jgi:hypothetical protein
MQVDLRAIPIYFINLPEQKTRYKTIVKMLSKAGFKDIRPIEGIRHTTSYLGVSLSHLKALRIGEQSGYPFIILEDDVDVNKFIYNFWLPDDTDIFYLGVAKSGRCFECGGLSMATGAKYEKYDDGLYRAVSLFCDHGKIYFTKAAVEAQKRMIAKSLKNRMQHDIYMWKECRGLLCLTTRFPMVYQNDPDPDKKLWKRDETMIDIEEYINENRMEVCDDCYSKQ